MAQITQLHGITPEELTKTILEGVDQRLAALRQEFQPKEPTSYLTRKQAADLLHISYVCLHDWTNKGILKAYKLGNRTYYRRDEVETALANSNKRQ